MFGAAPDALPTTRRCPACELGLDQLPVTARFCPSCGEALSVREPLVRWSSPRQSLRHRFGSLRSFLREHLGEEHQHAHGALALDQIHSLMLLGYSNAMLQLGWRYDTGDGVSRNAREACRCYSKSARLGNPYARAWLACKGVIFTPPDDEQPVPAVTADRPEESTALPTTSASSP